MVQRFAMGLVTAGLFAGTAVYAHQAKPAAQAAKPAPAAAKSAGAAKPAAGSGPVLVVETAKGNFEITTYTDDAPKSLAHFMDLVKLKTFYQGQRILWAQSNAVGFGDPNSKNMAKKDMWGTGGSGNAVGVAETSKRKFDRGLVVLYYQRGYPPKSADSQVMILKQANSSAEVEGRYAVLGKVTSGMDAVDKLEKTDVIKKLYVKDAEAK